MAAALTSEPFMIPQQRRLKLLLPGGLLLLLLLTLVYDEGVGVGVGVGWA